MVGFVAGVTGFGAEEAILSGAVAFSRISGSQVSMMQGMTYKSGDLLASFCFAASLSA
jgi:hypothetical protein